MKQLKRQLATVAFLCVVAVTLAMSVMVAAIDHYMTVLPVDPTDSVFRCRNCHVVENPTAFNDDLNPFGRDFLANGRVWSPELAGLNSDGDGCTNGVELGDSDGDGVLDGNVTRETGNPGVADDCGGGALTDPATWGALKALFQQ